jgi:hypothetical protein
VTVFLRRVASFQRRKKEYGRNRDSECQIALLLLSAVLKCQVVIILMCYLNMLRQFFFKEILSAVSSESKNTQYGEEEKMSE